MTGAKRFFPVLFLLSLLAGSAVWFEGRVSAHDATRNAKYKYDPDRLIHEKQIWHELQTRRLQAEGKLRAASRSVVSDVGDIAVVPATEQFLIEENLFDLNGRAILFTPATPGGYTVAASTQLYDATFGTKLNMAGGINPNPDADPGDDAYVTQEIGFAFRFYGVEYTSVAVSSNGFVAFRPAGISDAAFNEAATDSGESLSDLQSSVPRIAPYWHDLDGRASQTLNDRGVYFRREADRVIVTWNRMRDFPNDVGVRVGESSFQVTLFRDGRINFAFNNVDLTSEGLTGIGPGGRSDAPEVIDFRNPPSQPINNSIAEYFSTETLVDDFGVIKAFYDSRPGRDVWDFVYLVTDFQYDLGGGAFAFYLPIRNDITGIGDRPRNLDPDGATFGSRRVQGYLNLSSLVEPDPLGYPDFPTTRFLGSNNGLSIMAQEQGHRWGTFVRYPGTNQNFLLGRDNQHWSFFANVESTMSTPAAPRSSSMEGNVWRENGNGTFSTTSLVDGFTRFDHYLMGLRAPSEVGQMWVIDGPSGSGRNPSSAPRPNVTSGGTRRNVTIDEVIQANGARVPDSATAPKKWRVAWIFLTTGGAQPSQEALRKLARYRLAWESYFAQSTDYLGEVDSSLTDGNTEIKRITVTSGADYSPAVAPGAIATVFGRGLTSGRTERNTTVDLPTTLAGTQVLVNGQPAQLYLASPDQINFVMPRSTNATAIVPGGQVQSSSAFIEIIRDGQLVRAGAVQVSPFVPSIFSNNSTGSGPGAILDAFNFTAQPIAARRADGSPNIIALFGTGIGADGTDTGNNVAGDMQARINGQTAQVVYAGRSGFPGMNQVNVTLPAGIGAGTYNVELIRNGIVSNTVTVQLR